MQDTVLEAVAQHHFPTATTIILLAASDSGGMLFRDAIPELQAAGIAATSWDAVTGLLYLRRLPTANNPVVPNYLPDRPN